MRFGRQNRVRLARDFESARKNAAKVDCSAFVFYLCKSPADCPRLGVITSRRVGCAVERNKARRKIRAIFRDEAPKMKTNCDILVYVRRGFFKFDHQSLGAKFRYGIHRAMKIWESRNGCAQSAKGDEKDLK